MGAGVPQRKRKRSLTLSLFAAAAALMALPAIAPAACAQEKPDAPQPSRRYFVETQAEAEAASQFDVASDVPQQSQPTQPTPQSQPAAQTPSAGQPTSPAPTQQTQPASQTPPAQQPPSAATDPSGKHTDNPKRILGIIPNFQTTNNGLPRAMTAKEKYVLAYHQMFDISAHFGNLLQASIQQASNGEPHYGEGWGPFFERFAATEGDQYTSSFMIYGFLPAVLHDDPRYFRRGHGNPGRRVWYAVSRTVITRTDAQTPTFNVPQILGQLVQAGVSNAYYPKQDRTIGGTFHNWGFNLAYNSAYNLLKEFYPDFLRILRHQPREVYDPPPAKPLIQQGPAN
jgi:hypothetical protein